MALQPRIIACGNSLASYAMAVRFLVGPAVMAAASIAVGLRGVLLHIAIVQVSCKFRLLHQNASLTAKESIVTQQLSLNSQAALPQGIVPFVFAKEYNVHPNILSTAYDLFTIFSFSVLEKCPHFEVSFLLCPEISRPVSRFPFPLYHICHALNFLKRGASCSF